MSNFALLFPSNYISAADLDGKDTVVRIKTITPSEEVGQKKDKRPIVHFYNWPKGMVLNKTNAKRIAKLYGSDTDAWIDEYITLYPSECDFGDETVPCVRVRDSVPRKGSFEPDGDEDGEEEDLTDEELLALAKAKRKGKKATAGAT